MWGEIELLSVKSENWLDVFWRRWDMIGARCYGRLRVGEINENSFILFWIYEGEGKLLVRI